MSEEIDKKIEEVIEKKVEEKLSQKEKDGLEDSVLERKIEEKVSERMKKKDNSESFREKVGSGSISRRNFLKALGLGAGSLAFSSGVAANFANLTSNSVSLEVQSEGLTKVSNTSAVNFNGNFTVADNGDGAATVRSGISSYDETTNFAESEVTITKSNTFIRGGSVILSLDDVTKTGSANPTDNTESLKLYFNVSGRDTIDVSITENDQANYGYELHYDSSEYGTPIYDGTGNYSTTIDVSSDSGEVYVHLFVNDNNGTGSDYDMTSTANGFENMSGSIYVEWPKPVNVREWGAVTFRKTLAGETVEVYVEENDGSGWTEIQGPISQGEVIKASPSSDVRLRGDLSRNSTSNEPSLDALYRQWSL